MPDAHDPSDTWPMRRLGIVAAALAVLVGMALRLHTTSDLWLDEALSVHIARLPVGDLLEQLRRDGHPPLYYFLLHGWIELFGEGNTAVRSLSALFGIATLPLAWLAGRRYGGRGVAVAAVVLLATSPFAIRYATETRMYSLVMLLSLAGWLLVRRALEQPSPARLVPVAVVSGLLALTHYWAFYLLAAAGLLLLWLWRHGRPAALRVALGIVAGAVLFLPWLPSFLEQAGSTGTPWGRPERPTNMLTISFTDWGGGPNGEAQVLGIGLLLLILLALFGVARDGRRVELDLATRPAARAEVATVLLTMLLAVVAGFATASAFASRYTAVVFPLVVLVAALGTRTLRDPRVRAGVLVVVALLGLAGGVRNLLTERTQGGEVARYIERHGRDGDVVAFCPDQLGPAVTRVLSDRFETLRFPDGGDPELVDWVDYAERQAGGDPQAFAADLHERGAGSTVWIAWSPGYRTLGAKCETLVESLRRLRPGGRGVVASGGEFEHLGLYQYGPVPG